MALRSWGAEKLLWVQVVAEWPPLGQLEASFLQVDELAILVHATGRPRLWSTWRVALSCECATPRHLTREPGSRWLVLLYPGESPAFQHLCLCFLS